MIIIDEHDIGKTEEQLLTDLIFEATGQRIPTNVIKYKQPSALDSRPDIPTDPNTYIPFNAEIEYDIRLSGNNRGFLYRRRSLSEHFANIDLDLEFDTWPTTLHDVIINQINPILSYPLKLHDIIDYVIDDENTNSLVIHASPKSLFWVDSAIVSIVPPNSSNFVLVENRFLNGFNEWQL